MQERQLLKSSSNSLALSVTFNNKWWTVSNSERTLWRSTPRKDRMLTLSSIKWLRKITKWSESTKWNKNRANKIWSSQSMRRKHFFRDKKSSRNMKKSSLDNMHLNKRSVLIISLQWRQQLKLREKQFSINSRRKKLKGEQRTSMLKILEMISKLKKWKKGSEQKKPKLQQRSKEWKKNYRQPKTISFN